jgi:hypothetical protein
MSVLLPFLTLEQSCEQVDAWVRRRLVAAGFRIVPTFDLQAARLSHPDWPCPHHGTNECNCQMVILLVYGKQNEPATLIIHGQDGKTWLSLATPVTVASRQSLESSIRNLLLPRYPHPSSSIEINYEARSANQDH